MLKHGGRLQAQTSTLHTTADTLLNMLSDNVTRGQRVGV